MALPPMFIDYLGRPSQAVKGPNVKRPLPHAQHPPLYLESLGVASTG